MSPDTIDSLIVAVTEWLEKDLNDPDYLNDDDKYESFKEVFYSTLEPLCTKDRNYN